MDRLRTASASTSCDRSRRQAGRALRARGFASAAVLAWLAWGAGTARAESTLELGAAQVAPGDTSSVFLYSVSDIVFDSFAASISFDPAVLAIDEVTCRGTVSEVLKIEFFSVRIDPVQGELTVSGLPDALPPFDGQAYPGTGTPVTLARVVFSVPGGVAPRTTSLRFVDGLGAPPIVNLLGVDENAVVPDRTVDGTIDVIEAPGSFPRFVRGDANQDGRVDIADPICTVSFLFLGGSAPPCLDAADANDDETLDISDSVSILVFCFHGAQKPLLPFPAPGPDPVPLRPDLDCERTFF